MTDYPIPPRPTKIPGWLSGQSKATEEEIAKELVSINYWTLIDERAKIKAFGRVKEFPGWIVTLPLEKQAPELRAQYPKLVKEATEEITELMGSDMYARARAMAEASDTSFDAITRLGENYEQIQTRIALDLNESGLLPYLEHNSIEEFLLSKVNSWDGIGKPPGSYSETVFMITYLIPALEANGFPRKMILGTAENFYKARYAIPYLREILSDIIAKSNEIKVAMKDATDDEERMNLELAMTEVMKFDTRLHDIMEALVDEMSRNTKQGGMNAHKFSEAMKHIAKKTKPADKMLGYVYNLPTGGVLMINATDVKTLNALLNLTRKLVDYHQGSLTDMAREASRRLLLANQPEDIRDLLKGMEDGSNK